MRGLRMDVMEAIRKRRSIRKYKDKPLAKETIDAILEAAKYAPTARNAQELEYKVITNRHLMTKISAEISFTLKKEGAQATDRSDFFYGAPLLIIIAGPNDNKWVCHDAALAAENIMLYATSIALGTCFIGMVKRIENDATIMRELNMAENMTIGAAVICGYADETPEYKEKKLNAEFFK